MAVDLLFDRHRGLVAPRKTIMDIARPSVARQKKIRRTLFAVAGLVMVVLVTVALAQLKPAAPTVEFGSIWPDTVKRGSMVRQVRGPGTLVPEDIRWIAAQTSGRVERRLALPGTVVEADTVILELSDEQRPAGSARRRVPAARRRGRPREPARASCRTTCSSSSRTRPTSRRSSTRRKIEFEANEQLSKDGLQSAVITNKSRVDADELANRHRIEQERLKIRGESADAQLAAEAARVSQRRALYELKHRQADALKVRAGIAGVLQVVPVEVGQRVTPGANLARVAVPGSLKAELRIPETQARDVEIGQPAVVDTRNGEVRGPRGAHRPRRPERHRARGRRVHRPAAQGAPVPT